MKLKGEFQPDIGKECFQHFFQRTLSHLQISNFMHIWICLVYCAAIVSPGIISLAGRVWHRRVMHPNQVVAVAGAETPLHASIFTERDAFFGTHHKLDATPSGKQRKSINPAPPYLKYTGVFHGCTESHYKREAFRFRMPTHKPIKQHTNEMEAIRHESGYPNSLQTNM